MPVVPTSEIVRAVAVLGPHATARTVAGAVGMEVVALRERCAAEGIDLLGPDRAGRGAGRPGEGHRPDG